MKNPWYFYIQPVIWVREILHFISMKVWKWHLWNIKTFRRHINDGKFCAHRKLDTAWDRYWWKDTL